MKLPTEHQEQSTLIQWHSYIPHLELLFHIPNGGSRNILEAVNLKHAGVKSGVPDLFLPVPKGQYHGLFIEMKRNDKKSKVSKNQQWWIDKLRENGYFVEICYGFEDAKNTLEGYLRL